jgi:YHS domain-containing protein
MEYKDVNSTDTEINSAIDPVCGMTVNPKMTDIVATVEGQAYYFCADGCRKAFIENPKKYLEPKKKGWWGRYTERLEKATGGKAMKCH